jgi:hypothetical protein
LILTSNIFSGNISWDIENLSSLELLSLFDNKLNGQIPFNIVKLDNLKSVSIISYNSFSGRVPKALAQKDDFNLTMVNETGIVFKMKVSDNENGFLAADKCDFFNNS